MASRTLAVLLIASFVVAAFSQATFNCDDARALGTPDKNACDRLCKTVVQRNPNLAKLLNYCNTQCVACVKDVQKCKVGAKATLPATCQAASRFPQVLAVINECIALQKSGKAC